MKASDFLDILNCDFFTGVPDSLLSPFTNCIYSKYKISKKHIIAANEGNAVALAAGYHLATGKIPVIYAQNSGQGNMINPIASLLNDEVYAIPSILVIGWRGEPNVKDEPQHIFQGRVTIKLFDDMDIKSFVVDKDTTKNELKQVMTDFDKLLAEGKSVAFVIKKGALLNDEKISYKNNYSMTREDVIERITRVTGQDLVISTTGKASRELFEIREKNNHGHQYDFLTVGSMGHSSSIALGVALQKEDKKVWCIDGDGAAIMHLGAMVVIGANSPKNIVHIVINNESHETVGGMPTAAKEGHLDLIGVAKSCGYSYCVSVDTIEMLDSELIKCKEQNELSFIEVKCAMGSRQDLGRPTTTAIQNKISFMEYIQK